MGINSDNYWRLIPVLSASGRVQMAIDLWLLNQHRLGLHPPVLRFYTWSPAAISLGYHQRRYPESWNDLTWNGESIDLVRRPSGGRAVLHQGDLTYAAIVSGLEGSRMQAYETLCEFLVQGWNSIGVELHYGQAGRGYIHNPNCFGTATGADLVTSDDVKLIGSAQLRRDNAILQHGSMRIKPNAMLFNQVFGAEKLPKINTSIDTIINALTHAAINCFDIKLTAQPLTQSEWSAIKANLE